MKAGTSADRLLALYILFVAKKDQLLELDARRKVFRFVRDYPGLHLREIARGLDMETNHAKYHLSYLEKHDLLSSRKEDGFWRFWPVEQGRLGTQEALGVDEKRVMAYLRKPLPLHVTLILLERGPCNQSALQEAVGVARPTLHYHMKSMEKDGVVTSEKHGRERVYTLVDAERIEALLLEYKPPDALVAGFLDAWEALEL